MIDRHMPQDGREAVAVKATNIVKTYGSTGCGINGLSFEITKGEIFSVLGPNGSGKSTLLKSLAGILRLNSGTIEIYGQNMALEPEKAKSNLVYIPDSNTFYAKIRVNEYLNFISTFYRIERGLASPRIERLLSILGLANKNFSFLTELSQGQRKKVDIVAALAVQPRLIVADEVFSGLDYETVPVVLEKLYEHVALGNSLIFSTHDLGLAERTSNLLVFLNNGKIDERATYQRQLSRVLSEMNGRINCQCL